MLSAFGMRHVTDASDGAEALERLEQGQFEILIVDWEMPVLDGADFVRLVRNPDHLFCYAPIIMITGHSTYRRTQEALALGVNDVLCKPFSPQALYARIADNVLKPRPFIRSPDAFGPRRVSTLKKAIRWIWTLPLKVLDRRDPLQAERSI